MVSRWRTQASVSAPRRTVQPPAGEGFEERLRTYAAAVNHVARQQAGGCVPMWSSGCSDSKARRSRLISIPGEPPTATGFCKRFRTTAMHARRRPRDRIGSGGRAGCCLFAASGPPQDPNSTDFARKRLAHPASVGLLGQRRRRVVLCPFEK
jgi:hypothetical protein